MIEWTHEDDAEYLYAESHLLPCSDEELRQRIKRMEENPYQRGNLLIWIRCAMDILEKRERAARKGQHGI